MAGDDTEARVISDLLERIDKLTQHIIDIKGDMYRRSEWSADAARIYDSISATQQHTLNAVKEAVLAFERRCDNIEKEHLTLAAFQNYRDLHEKDCAEDRKTLKSIEGRVGDLGAGLQALSKRVIHPAIIGFVGSGIGAAITWSVQHALAVMFPTKP